MDRPTLSVVAPCYNEQEVLPEFARRMVAACQRVGLPYEIVLVNDGSRDGTWAAMQDLASEHAGLVCVNLSRNHGHQLAVTAGLHVARGQRVLIIDADLQDQPELLPRMLDAMDGPGLSAQAIGPAGLLADVVYGQRGARKGESAFKLFTASLFYRLIDRLTDVPIPRDTGDFRLMSRRAVDVLLSMPERHRFVRGMVSWIGFRQAPLVYERDARFAGETKYPFRKMFRLALDAVTSFSIKPLTWASTLGFIAAVFSLGLFAYSVISWLVFKAQPGWTSIMAGVALLSSVQLFVLGIFGEYLGRLCEQAKGRPLFIIESVVTSPEASGAEAAPRVPSGLTVTVPRQPVVPAPSAPAREAVAR